MQNAQKTVELKKEIVLACHKLYQRSLVANHDGNVTCLLDDGSFLATPTAFSKGDVQVADILTLDPSGKVIDGPHKVFSEIAWHRAIYRVRPDVRCVVHGHPPCASGMGLSQKEMGTPALPEAIVSLGRHILTARFFSPLDPDLQKSQGAFDLELHRVLSESDAFVARGNGAWAVGQDVLQAYYRLELVEHLALQHGYAEKFGGAIGLPTMLVDELMKKRPAPQLKAVSPSPVDSTPLRIQEIVRRELEEILARED